MYRTSHFSNHRLHKVCTHPLFHISPFFQLPHMYSFVPGNTGMTYGFLQCFACQVAISALFSGVANRQTLQLFDRTDGDTSARRFASLTVHKASHTYTVHIPCIIRSNIRQNNSQAASFDCFPCTNHLMTGLSMRPVCSDSEQKSYRLLYRTSHVSNHTSVQPLFRNEEPIGIVRLFSGYRQPYNWLRMRSVCFDSERRGPSARSVYRTSYFSNHFLHSTLQHIRSTHSRHFSNLPHMYSFVPDNTSMIYVFSRSLFDRTSSLTVRAASFTLPIQFKSYFLQRAFFFLSDLPVFCTDIILNICQPAHGTVGTHETNRTFRS